MLYIRKIQEEAKPKKAFLLTGAFNPYTIGHEEAARQAAHHAVKTGHTHIFHGLGSSAEQHDAPLTHKQKTSVVRASHRHIKKDVKGIKFGIVPAEHDNPFKQVLHLAKTGHTHITLGLGSDQMKKKALRGQLEKHVAQHGGMKDKEGNVHPVTLSFKQMGKKRNEAPLHRTELLTRLRKGDLRVAKAGHLRKAVASGDTELAHALMPASVNKKKYFNAIGKQQARLRKQVKEGFIPFDEFLVETETKKQRNRREEYTKNFKMRRLKDILKAQQHIATNLGKDVDYEDQEKQANISHRSMKMAIDSINRKLGRQVREDIELDPYIDPPSGKMPKFRKSYIDTKKFTHHPEEEKYTGHRNLGEIHPGYELHRHTTTVDRATKFHRHSFSIVHKKSGDVAGEIDAKGGKIDRKTGEHRLGTGKGLKIDWVHVHPEHGTKKIGTSLAAAAYKHLHKLGHSIKSDTKQSIGGANLWNSLRHDPDTKHHMMYHDERNYEHSIPAHKVPEGAIWNDDPHAHEITLVLHAAKKTRAKKTVSEDISIVDVPQEPYQKKRKAKDVHQDYGTKTYSNETIVTKKNHGEIHPGYELHQHSKLTNLRGKEVLRHKFTVVHKASGDVAGEMHSWGGKLHPHKGHVMGPKGKGMVVSHLDFDPDHSSKKVGTSLPVAMYRHLHRKGFSIQADSAQSHGGAHVWNTMRKDKELGKHMVMHELDDSPTPPKTRHSFSTLASKAPESQIWYQKHRDQYQGIEKVKPQHGGMERDVTLILTGKKRKKVVKEDIEMADVLSKPHGGYHRSWENYKEITGTKPHKSARIAPGYVMHSSVPNKNNPEIEIHHIVHAKTGHIAGEVHTHETMSGARTAVSVQIHGDHTKKKIGRSLAIDAYKHLAKEKPLRSSSLQSPGGASIWDRLRKDPKMKGRVFHGGRLDRPDVPAHDLDSKQIWASERKVETSKGTPKPLHGGGKTLAHERQQVMGSRLYIMPLKKKASKKS